MFQNRKLLASAAFACILLAPMAGNAQGPQGPTKKSPKKPPVTVPKCENGKIVSGPRGSVGQPCGSVPGGPCKTLKGGDPWEVQPNGDFSSLTRCDSTGEGEQMVCVKETISNKNVGVCKICDNGDLVDPLTHTMIGCPAPAECPGDLSRGTDGKCWSASKGRPKWECEADCTKIYGSEGFCVHDTSWRGLFPDLYQSSYQEPICATRFSCNLTCPAQGKACNPETDKCVAECTKDSDCEHYNKSCPNCEGAFKCSPQLTCRL